MFNFFKINKINPDYKLRTLTELKNGEILLSIVRIILTGMLANEMSEYGNEMEEWRQLLASIDHINQIEQKFLCVHYVIKEVLKVNREVNPVQAKQGDEFELARVCLTLNQILIKTIVIYLSIENKF
jgi:hypothetical protein